MKTKRLFGVIALMAVIGFTMAALSLAGCSDGGGGGDDGPKTVTYTGTAGGTTYILVITGDTAYVLTVGQKTSSGTVMSNNGGVLTLKPSNAEETFTATVSGSGLTAMNGTITYTDDTTASAPSELTPSGGGGGGGTMTWTAVTDNSLGIIFAIAYGNGKFVAGDWNGKMVYSPDGVNWTAVANSTFGTSMICAIAYGNGKFVAGGSGGKMAYSSDGVNWTAIPEGTSTGTSTFGTDNTIYAIAYGNDKFVAGGSGGKMAYSSDGVTWIAVTDSTFGTDYITSDITAIAYGNGKFVAGGSGGKMAYSSDGVTWTAVTSSVISNMSIHAIAYGNDKFVAGGPNGKMAYSSDGATWTAVTDSTFGTNRINVIAYGNGKFVAGGDIGKMAYSTDGVTWTAINTGTAFNYINSEGGISVAYIHAIAYGNNKFVAGCDVGKMVYSGNDGGNNQGSGSLGTTFTITNAQVYNFTSDYKVGTPYNGTVQGGLNYIMVLDPASGEAPLKSLSEVISGSPSVTLTNGKLSISLGMPKPAALWSLDSLYTGLTISTSDAKCFMIFTGFYSSTDESTMAWLLQVDDRNDETGIEYIYVDKNVKITGTYDGETTTTIYAMDLKTGWNLVIVESTKTGEHRTTTEKTATPTANHKWAIDVQ
ncbi:MAG: hypothetical protein LBB89_00370 [Treponema sp.]|jgi:hypothetical protein|nr:hypothetical protein [Treponema sp.]